MLLVQKYGGTSVASIECMQQVADRVCKAKALGHSLIVVLSAMSGETDKLLNLANQASKNPSKREIDVLLATGEQITVALLSIILQDRGYVCKSYLAWQIPIITDEVHGKARILEIDNTKINADLTKGIIVIVAGFQGIDKNGDVTTLGRGGSDTTAVALAASLKASECQIYTDVDGVYTTDPRIVPQARRMAQITFEEMLELSSLGAKVLQIRSVEFAGKHGVPIRVLSTFVDGPGTLITLEGKSMEQPLLSGIAFNRNEAKLSILGLPNEASCAARILEPISKENIDVDVIVQNIGNDGRINFTFTVNKVDYQRALEILQVVALELNAQEVVGDLNVAKVSLVGVGMRSHPGIASTMFRVLGEEGIKIQLISTSEIKVSVIIDEKYLELAVRSLHAVFKLNEEPKEAR